MKRNWVIGLAMVLAAILIGVYFLLPAHTPDGQPQLVEINDQTLPTLQAEFNRTADRFRVILLFSPT